MVYTFLISIVFIAELIIAITVIQNLLRLDKKVIELDETISLSKPSIKDISILIRKISEQWIVITENFIDKTKKESEEFFLRRLLKLLLGILVINLNIKFINNIRNSKITKIIVKSWSFLENMV